MSGFKSVIVFLHRWLGLISGLVVFIIAITGALYAFKEEILDYTQPFRFCKAEQSAPLPPSVLMPVAQQILPGKSLHAMYYAGEGRNAKAIFFAEAEEHYYWQVYVNPHTGKVVAAIDEETGFFPFILRGHFYLWLPEKIGQPVVAIATLVFFVMLVSGIILWWPKKKKQFKQKISIHWSARWRRRNYDIHQVVGFYTAVFALVFVVTGLVWGFSWFMKSYYFVASAGKSYVDYYEPVSVANEKTTTHAIDKVFYKLLKENPNAQAIEVHPPHDSTSVIAANVNPDRDTYWKTDYRYFDQYSLKEINVDHVWGRWHQASVADKLLRMNYDLHVGAMFGLFGKIIACLVSLLIASMPITGFLVWWGRRNKSKTKKPVIAQFDSGTPPAEPASC